MPGTIVPDDFISHELNPIKGWWDGHAVDKVAPVKDGEVILAGRVGHLNLAGEVELGLEDNTVGLLAFPSSTDFDVSADRGNIQSQNLLTLPVIASFEVQSTEFVVDTYQIGNHLTAAPGTAGADAGKVKKGEPFVDTLVGHVTKGVEQNENRKDILTFWTYYLPISIGGGS